MPTVLVHASNTATGEFELAAAADAAGITTVRIESRRPGAVESVVAAARSGAAYRSPGGLLARAIDRGASIELAGAGAAWFAALPASITGRTWALTDVAGARSAVAAGAAFVKLAEDKFRGLPARRYRDPTEFDAALTAVNARSALQLLVTDGWLSIHSEYRTFTVGREVLAFSPYLVEDDPWTPLLRTHRGSFHESAAAFADNFLASLASDDVPPTAVLDVARLVGGSFVLLEVNHVWSSGLYGCDPYPVLDAVIAAAAAGSIGTPGRWRWRPDPALTALARRNV